MELANMTCDLHTHSIYSDGSYTPAEIIAEAKKLGLTVALTDHNTVSGVAEFMKAAEEQGVTSVAGTELSTAYEDKELHLLGLFIKPEHYNVIERLVKEFHVLKEISNMEMIERLCESGYQIEYTSVKKRNPEGNANRAHVAAELLEKGYVSSINEAFHTLLGDGMGFYVPPARLQLTDAIKFLREIGAIPILAHPLQDLSESELRSILPVAKEAGLLGIETRHSSYDRKTELIADKIAQEFDLVASGGSDFHGTNKPTIFLGVGKGDMSVPLAYYENLKALHASLA